jgi:hypothetical protein
MQHAVCARSAPPPLVAPRCLSSAIAPSAYFPRASPSAGGSRAYVAIAGGLDVPDYLGSKSTFPGGTMGGHQGRPLRVGDMVPLGAAGGGLHGGGRRPNHGRLLTLNSGGRLCTAWVVTVTGRLHGGAWWPLFGRGEAPVPAAGNPPHARDGQQG